MYIRGNTAGMPATTINCRQQRIPLLPAGSSLSQNRPCRNYNIVSRIVCRDAHVPVSSTSRLVPCSVPRMRCASRLTWAPSASATESSTPLSTFQLDMNSPSGTRRDGEENLDVDVAVVGGGPAGLAVAIALSKVLDPSTRIKVFEASSGFPAGGAGLALRVNGLRALEALHPSIVHSLYERGSYSLKMHSYDEITGKENSNSAVPNVHERNIATTGHTNFLLYWNDLRQTLYEYVPPGVVEFGCRLRDCEPLLDGTTNAAATVGGGADGDSTPPVPIPLAEQPYRYVLTMQRSSGPSGVSGPSLRADQDSGSGSSGAKDSYEASELLVRAKYVVGADGYFSRVRRKLGDGQMPTFTGTVCWRGSFPPEQLSGSSDGTAVPLPAVLATPAGRASSHRWFASTHGGGILPSSFDGTRLMMLLVAGDGKGVGVWYLQAAVAAIRAAGVEYPAEGAAGLSGEEALRRGLTAFQHLPEDVRAMLAATPPDRVTEHGLYLHSIDKYLPGSWTSGHVVVVGDAAHASPPDGQGASLAIEDAVVLAHVVQRHGGLSIQALAEWEALRQPHVCSILSDTKPPFLARAAIINATTFEPLWSPEELLLEPASATGAAAAAVGGIKTVQEGLEWSRRVVADIVERKVAEATAAQQV